MEYIQTFMQALAIIVVFLFAAGMGCFLLLCLTIMLATRMIRKIDDDE